MYLASVLHPTPAVWSTTFKVENIGHPVCMLSYLHIGLSENYDKIHVTDVICDDNFVPWHLRVLSTFSEVENNRSAQPPATPAADKRQLKFK